MFHRAVWVWEEGGTGSTTLNNSIVVEATSREEKEKMKEEQRKRNKTEKGKEKKGRYKKGKKNRNIAVLEEKLSEKCMIKLTEKGWRSLLLPGDFCCHQEEGK